jgi:hypothetical protein
MSDPAVIRDMAARCLRIADLIEQYDYGSQADMLREMQLLADHEPSDFVEALSDGRVWGSSGSVLDIWLPGEEGPNGRNPMTDQRMLDEELLRLAEGIKRCGDPNQIAPSVIELLGPPS